MVELLVEVLVWDNSLQLNFIVHAFILQLLTIVFMLMHFCVIHKQGIFLILYAKDKLFEHITSNYYHSLSYTSFPLEPNRTDDFSVFNFHLIETRHLFINHFVLSWCITISFKQHKLYIIDNLFLWNAYLAYLL